FFIIAVQTLGSGISILLAVGTPSTASERKTRKGQNQIKQGKLGEARRSQKQLQSREQEKLKKMKVEGPKMKTPTKFY
nr:hypothetical protein [Tanacetum cinerariifolium]